MILLDKKKGESKAPSKDLLKGIFPDNFTLIGKGDGKKDGNKDDKKGDNKIVTSYAKYITPHLLHHYDSFAISMISSKDTLNVSDFIYYSTYGDYRMDVDASGKLSFRYEAISDIGTRNPSSSSFQNPLIRPSQPDHLYGVYKRTDGPTFLTWNIEEIKALTQELNTGSAGTRLMLPSIGTMMMMTYGYANINAPLNKLVKRLIVKLDSLMSDVTYNGAPFDIFDYLAEAMIADDFVTLLRAEFGAIIEINNFRDGCKQEAIDNGIEAAAEMFANKLIKDEVSQFVVGDLVEFKEKASIPVLLEGEISALYSTQDPRDITYRISDLGLDNNKKYVYELELVDTGDVVPNEKASQSILKPVSEPTRELQKKKEKFYAKPSAPEMVAYSRLMDQFFALHSYALLAQDNGGTKKLNTGYISPVINPSKKKEQIVKDFRMMGHPNANNTPYTAEDVCPQKASLGNSLNMTLAMMRLKYTDMCLTAQRDGAADKRVLDEFYNENLTVKEIKWLAYTLSDEAKIITREPEKTNLLTQLSYTPTGASEGVQLYGEANRRTIFYYIDIPMLKEVMLEYIYAFNELTVRAAYSLDSNQKEGTVAKALWGSIKRRTEKLFESAEVVPYKFFSGLFQSVNQVISTGELTSFDPYPPTWSDTNILSQLTLDPSETTTLPVEEYAAKLAEYIDYLYLRYSGRPRIAAAILTAIEGYKIKESTEYDKLRTGFIDMIEEHNKKSQLKTTDYTLPVYLLVLSIMRAELQVPLELRQDYIVAGYEEQAQKEKLKQSLDDPNRDRRKIVAFPPEHPMYTPPAETPPPAPPVVLPGAIRTYRITATSNVADGEYDVTLIPTGAISGVTPAAMKVTFAGGTVTSSSITDGGGGYTAGDTINITNDPLVQNSALLPAILNIEVLTVSD